MKYLTPNFSLITLCIFAFLRTSAQDSENISKAQVRSLYYLSDSNAAKEIKSVNKKLETLIRKKDLKNPSSIIHIYGISVPDSLTLNKEVFESKLFHYLHTLPTNEKNEFGESGLNITQSLVYNKENKIIGRYENPTLYKIEKEDPYYFFYNALAGDFFNKKFSMVFYIFLSNSKYLFETNGKFIQVVDIDDFKHYSLQEFINCCWESLFLR